MVGAAFALFLLDIKDRVLVWHDYCGDVSAVQAEKFFTKLIEKEGDPESQDPVVYDNGVTYMFIQHNNLFLMTASRQNCNAASLLLFLHRVVDVTKDDCPVIFHDSFILSQENGSIFEKRVTELSPSEFLSYDPQRESGNLGKPLLRKTNGKIVSWNVETDDVSCTLQEAFHKGNDVGTQYRSGIFFYTPEQEKAAIESRDRHQKLMNRKLEYQRWSN